ncbi:DUF3037 domain-containing protein [Chitinophaga pinensis]|uniref:DUF3037 domain-containing protein n=1 Tax=Chitinophaga pinensis TaxID=79329 RepID=A0A5C6LU29_9BACT|nr:DUF3037 domain-containing protein [Chitinophaga pinensis]TWW00068.1 DUF3037 domain-containing protein [Chitinophaga pinensis]
MQEKHLFEYAVIRVMPRVEREEFLNAGVILYSKQQRFLQAIITLNEERLRAFSPETDIEEVKSYLNAFEYICKGGKEAGPIGQLDLASRFRWLTATRSTVVQAGKVHPGFCNDLPQALIRLHEKLVL